VKDSSVQLENYVIGKQQSSFSPETVNILVCLRNWITKTVVSHCNSC